MTRKSLAGQLGGFLPQRLQAGGMIRADWLFIRMSSLNSLGIAIARVLGFAFSFVIARAYDADQYGYVVYTLMLASVISMAAQPFGQHVMAYTIGKYRRDPDQLDQVMDNAWSVWVGLILLTLVLAVPLLLVFQRFSWSVLVVFIGTAVFYMYYGVSSGFISSSRLLAVYLSSNVLQILLVGLVVFVIHVDSVTPAILIYGLSYFPPLLVVTRLAPLPLRFRLRWDSPKIRQILRLSFPIWLSHLLYLGYSASDVLLLGYFAGNREVGIYGLTKTISSVFVFFPTGIRLFLMPQIAGAPKEDHPRILRQSLLTVLVVNLVGVVLYLFLYRWFITRFIGREYYDGLWFGFFMAMAAILYGFHTVVSAMLVGAQRAEMETFSRIAMMVIMIGAGVVLIPALGALGTAITSFAAVAGSLLFYAALLLFRSRQ
jgi:O-antigen/teichoic acid export membrane protein